MAAACPTACATACATSCAPKYKLTYFDLINGRGEPIRLAFAIGGIGTATLSSLVSDPPLLC